MSHGTLILVYGMKLGMWSLPYLTNHISLTVIDSSFVTRCDSITYTKMRIRFYVCPVTIQCGETILINSKTMKFSFWKFDPHLSFKYSESLDSFETSKLTLFRQFTNMKKSRSDIVTYLKLKCLQLRINAKDSNIASQ